MTTAEIIKANTRLIYKIAGNFYGVDKEDLFQAGALGIVKAYQSYKDDGTTKFSTYAFKSIFGEMYALASQKQIKVSRDYLRLYKSIEKTRYSLAQKWNRIPTNEELAIYLGIDILLIEEAIQAASVIVNSLDKAADSERSIYETIPYKENISTDDKIAIHESLDLLDEDERQIIKYRYFEDLTQTEIARKLNMTQVMVSRYEKKGINKLRSYYVQN